MARCFLFGLLVSLGVRLLTHGPDIALDTCYPLLSWNGRDSGGVDS